MKIQYFTNVTDTQCTNTIDFIDLIANIKEGRYMDDIISVRAATTKEERQKAKKKLPAVTISGRFSSRKDTGLIEHSGLIAIDFDDVTEQEIKPLKSDKFTRVGFVSASGKGYCVIVAINAGKHRESFRQLAEYYYTEFGLIADSSCINESRLRYISYDPDLIYSPNSLKFTCKSATKPSKEVQKTSNFIPYLQSDFDNCVAQICSNGVDITDSYDNWIRLAFALASEFGESGRQAFHEISSISPKYKYEIADKKYTNALTTSRGSIGIATFFHLCKEHGVKYDLTRAQEIAKKGVVVKQAHGTREDLIRQYDPTGGSEPTQEEVSLLNRVYDLPNPQEALDEKPNKYQLARNYLNTHRNIWIEEFSGKIYDGDNIMDELQINTLWEELNSLNIHLKKNELIQMMESTNSKVRNPIAEYYDGLIWDGTIEEADSCFTTLVAPLDLAYKDLAPKWMKIIMLGVVQTFYGKPAEVGPVFIGSLSTGKTGFSRFLFDNQIDGYNRSLCPLGEYFRQPELSGTKDDLAELCNNLILFQDDTIDKRIREYDGYKNITSIPKVTFRKPYGTGSLTKKRISTIWITTNHFDILPNEKNRRMVPFHFLSLINWVMLHERVPDIAHYWAAAVYLYKQGYRVKLTNEDIAELELMGKGFKGSDFVHDMIDRYFHAPELSEIQGNEMTASDVLHHLSGVVAPSLLSKTSSVSVGRALQHLGYRRSGKKWVIFAVDFRY